MSTVFGKPLVAVATKGGQPSKGVSVTFTAPGTGASGTFANGSATETDTTDSNGLATSSKFTANSTDGTYNVTATASGAQASATFSLTNLAATQLTISPQSPAESTLAGTAYPTPFSVVVDQNGSPIQGVSVTFTAPSSGASGTFNGGGATDTVTTDKNGQATSSNFTANATAGQFNVLATVVGGSAPAQFSLNNLSAASLTVVASGGSPQSAAIGTAFGQPLQVGVFNSGFGVQGVSVTFTAPAQSGASGTFTGGVTTETDVTDSTGLATAHSFTANQTTGNYQVTGTISDNTEIAAFNLTNTSALTVSMGSGDNQTTKVGTQFPAPLVAHVVDTQNQPAVAVTVTFAAPGTGASGSYTSGGTSVTAQVPTDQNGNASTPFYANSTSGGPYVVTATVLGGTASAAFNLTNSSSAVSGVIPTGGIIQRAAIGATFQKKFVATVLDHNGNPLSGQSVTFTAPPSSAGATGTFLGGVSSEIDTTDSSGNAISSNFTANGTAGSYMVTASNGSVTGKFTLINTAAPVTSYTFYASGQSLPHSGGLTTNYYAIAGAIIVDQSNGAVLGGEEDYNDANGSTYANLPITGGTLSVDTNGQGTLALSVPSQQTLGNSGTETFGIQFVNTNHALIAQWDGSGTSSGSMDVQDLTSAPSGGYAFTFSGVDPNYAPIGFGGVFSITGNLLNPQYSMSLDFNDASYGVVNQPNMSGLSITSLDDYGRGQINGVALNTQPAINLTLYFYLIGAEALRVIDMDTTIAAVGSAFGQGIYATEGDNSALGQSVFAIAGSPSTGNPNSVGTTSYAALGQFTTDGAGTLSSGIADEKELATNFLIGVDLGSTGTYQVGTNGYGTLTLPANKLGDVSALGLYLTDPTLNLNDPNNTSGGGGGLLLDLDPALPGGTGFVIPQTDASAASFNGSYAAGWQNLNSFHGAGLEFDMLAQGTITATTDPSNLNLAGLVSDPFGSVNNGTALESSLASFTSNPDTDSSHPGRYTMLGSNPNNNLLDMTIQGTTVAREFNEVVYQASGNQLFWIDVDNNGFTFDAVSFGPLELQGSLTGIPLSRSSAGKVRKSGAAAEARHPMLRAE